MRAIGNRPNPAERAGYSKKTWGLEMLHPMEPSHLNYEVSEKDKAEDGGHTCIGTTADVESRVYVQMPAASPTHPTPKFTVAITDSIDCKRENISLRKINFDLCREFKQKTVVTSYRKSLFFEETIEFWISVKYQRTGGAPFPCFFSSKKMDDVSILRENNYLKYFEGIL